MTPQALPNTVIIGAMKCATTAVYRYLAAHPDVNMSYQKETNFFIGPARRPHDVAAEWWREGQWHRGLTWYKSLFDPARPVRGESSPGYTSPAHPEAAQRMGRLLPRARLIYLVRNPMERAVSQYAHHRRDRTERRPLGEALLDTRSQYVARSRYHERLQPFLRHFPREQILVVVQERLLRDRRRQLDRLFRHVGADPRWWSDELEFRIHAAPESLPVPGPLQARFNARVSDDTARLRELLGDDLAEWTAPRN